MSGKRSKAERRAQRKMKWVPLSEFTAPSEGEERILGYVVGGQRYYEHVVWRRHVDGLDEEELEESGGCWESEGNGETYLPMDDWREGHYILSGFTPPPVPEMPKPSAGLGSDVFEQEPILPPPDLLEPEPEPEWPIDPTTGEVIKLEPGEYTLPELVALAEKGDRAAIHALKWSDWRMNEDIRQDALTLYAPPPPAASATSTSITVAEPADD